MDQSCSDSQALLTPTPEAPTFILDHSQTPGETPLQVSPPLSYAKGTDTITSEFVIIDELPTGKSPLSNPIESSATNLDKTGAEATLGNTIPSHQRMEQKALGSQPDEVLKC